jgi:GNAT superfamily N-acetyltransferase
MTDRHWAHGAVEGQLVIRRVTCGDDTEVLGDLLRHGYQSASDHHSIDYLDEIADVAGRLHHSLVVVGELQGRPVACLTYLPGADNALAEHGDPEAASFRYFAVHPEMQGRGVGRAMVQWVLDIARSEGKRRVRIHTQEPLRAARSLYESMGFVRDPSRDEPSWGGLAFVCDVAP